MAVFILSNTVGLQAATWTSVSGEATGFPDNDMISGPRSLMWRSLTALATHDNTFESSTHPGAGDLFASHIVVARSDLAFRNQAGALTYRLKYWNGATSVTMFGPNVIGSSDLIGVRNQDYCTSFTRTASTQWEFIHLWGGATKSMLAKIYICDSFEFNKDPVTDLQLNVLTAPDIVRPMRATRPYEIEATFALTWRHITLAKLAAFRAIVGIFHHPIFIYDDAAAVLPWKLEHAIITGWTETLEHKDLWSITVNFARLKHYD